MGQGPLQRRYYLVESNEGTIRIVKLVEVLASHLNLRRSPCSVSHGSAVWKTFHPNSSDSHMALASLRTPHTLLTFECSRNNNIQNL